MSAQDEKGPVGIVGLGTMGGKIAELCLANGHTVLAITKSPESGRKGLQLLERALLRRVDKGRITAEAKESMLSRIRLVSDQSEFSSARIVIEAVNEDPELKRRVYDSLEPHLSKDAILATNTSSLSVVELSDRMRDPTRFLGLHFFNPPDVMKLVEVRRGVRTSPDVASRAKDFVRGLGRVPIDVPDVPGYYVNRILFPMLTESMQVLQTSGADPKSIDDAMKLGANLPMGPLELADFIGNDVVLRICEILHERTRDQRFEPPEILVRMVREGRLGRKTGKGFHSY